MQQIIICVADGPVVLLGPLVCFVGVFHQETGVRCACGIVDVFSFYSIKHGKCWPPAKTWRHLFLPEKMGPVVERGARLAFAGIQVQTRPHRGTGHSRCCTPWHPPQKAQCPPRGPGHPLCLASGTTQHRRHSPTKVSPRHAGPLHTC